MKYTLEFVNKTLIDVVKECQTYADVCRRIGVKPGGGNQAYLKSVIEKHKIPTNHFVGISWATGTKHKNNRNYDYLRDEYSGFRIFLTKIKSRNIKNSNLTLADLKQQWIKQNGRCVYSNVLLNLPSKSTKRKRIYTASVDRINSSIGYVRGNIQFISVACNFAKNCMTHEEMLEFCDVLRNVQSIK